MQELEYPFDGAMILQKKRALKRKLLEKDGLVPKKIAIMSGSTTVSYTHLDVYKRQPSDRQSVCRRSSRPRRSRIRPPERARCP